MDAGRIHGWCLRQTSGDVHCPRCGQARQVLYQARRLEGRYWHDVPGALLCHTCLQERFTARAAASPEAAHGPPAGPEPPAGAAGQTG